MISPSNAVYPKNKIKEVHVLYDGTLSGNKLFSIAKLKLHDGSEVLGIRHDYSDWSPNPDKGYPLSRPGNPAWFVLPPIVDLLPVLKALFDNTDFLGIL